MLFLGGGDQAANESFNMHIKFDMCINFGMCNFSWGRLVETK